jgi:serine protease AprX
MKKRLHLTIILFTFFALSANAQTKEERAKNVDSINRIKLEELKTRFETNHLNAETKVKDYLKKHPKLQRTFIKNGSTYYLHHIDGDGKPVYINTKNKESGVLIKADQLYKGGSIGANITGEGMVVGVWDGGQVRETHELLAGNVTMQANQTLDGVGANKAYGGNNHMTHVSGTIVGKDITNQPAARGIAYGAKAQCYDWNSDLSEMADFGTKGYLISNHSYGYSNDTTTATWNFGAYDETAKNWDLLLRNLPNYLPFIAAGNEQEDSGNRKAKLGYDIITGSSASKNAMTVGAVNGDKSMSDYSNWGPTDDGRVKPDIVTKGTGINSSLYADKTSKTPSDTAYSGTVNSQGTSYASPAAAASGLLLQQYYNSLHKTYMKSSTLKALMLGTAEDLGQPGPDHKFGWGLLNVEKAANAIKYKSVIGSPLKAIMSDSSSKGAYIEEISLKFPADTITEVSREITASGCEPLIVSIAWTDIEGIEQTSKDGIDPTASRLIYDYDMLVKNISKNTIYRTWKPSVMANRIANATHEYTWFDGNGNNYKQVKIDSAIAGDKYKIYLRKKTTSPDSVRLLSLVVTGTAFAKPLLAATQNFCSPSTATIASLTVTGTGIKWYNALTGGKIIADTTKLIDKTSYYASQTILGCESPRGAIAVTQSPILEAPIAHETNVKLGTSVTLVATCAAGTPNWYATSTSGTSLGSVSFTTPELAANTAYYVDCESGKNPTCVSSRTHQILRVQITNSTDEKKAEGVVNTPKEVSEAKIGVKNEANFRVKAESADNDSDVFINVFPNPTTGLFYWKLLSNEPSGVNLTMYNSMGTEQLNQSFSTLSQTHEGTIDLNKIETGVYFLKFNVGEKNIIRKIIKN